MAFTLIIKGDMQAVTRALSEHGFKQATCVQQHTRFNECIVVMPHEQANDWERLTIWMHAAQPLSGAQAPDGTLLWFGTRDDIERY